MAKDTLAAQIKEIVGQIEILLDRVVDASGGSLVRAYQVKIAKLEKRKLLFADQAAQAAPPAGRFDVSIEHTLMLLANACNIYEKRGVALRRTVLKSFIAEPLSCSRESVCRIDKTTIFSRRQQKFQHESAKWWATLGRLPYP